MLSHEHFIQHEAPACAEQVATTSEHHQKDQTPHPEKVVSKIGQKDVEPPKVEGTLGEIDWNGAVEAIISGALGEIPYVGGILSGLLGVFWPQDDEDVWGEIEAQVEALINEKIAQSTYDRVAAVLGTASEDTGMIGVLNNYLGAVNKTNGQDPFATWTSANTYFIGQASVFQQQGSEVLLLPLFAQMANLHLNLLRDGVLQKFCAASELQQYISSYTSWANAWSAQAVTDVKAKTKQFNTINQVTRYMQISVLNYVHLWPYLDTSVYPNPVTDLPLGTEIFYTITENLYQVNSPIPQTPPGTLAGYISEIDIWSGNNGYIFLGGNVSTYDSGAGKTPYYGVPTSYGGGQAAYSITSTNVNSETNPIIRIDGNWSYDAYTRYVQFTFKNNTYTQYIPSTIDSNSDSNSNFTIIPPPGYWLSSVYFSPSAAFYNASYDAAFGFQNFSRPSTSDQEVKISHDVDSWKKTCPVEGSANWVKGYSVKYAILWVYQDKTTSNLCSWSAPITSEKYALPTLLLPINPDPKVVQRRIFRQFTNSQGFSPLQLVDTIDNKVKRWEDVHP
ncbi:hypothetical protein ABW20_dc0109660 [Dactylellina cionopaga]|nr:hypothetical protein ABW20_dc0109660 [Dactylellina cionopaga]